jgi:chaperonin GroEL (HSP60 family)
MSGLEDAVLRNIEAVAELSNLVRTSFGPNGMRLLCSFASRNVDGIQVEISSSSIT